MTTTQETNLWLRPVGGPPDGSRDIPTGTVYWHQGQRGAHFAFRVALTGNSRHRNADAWGLNAAVLQWLKAHHVSEVYRTDRATGQTYKTTTFELERAGFLTPLKEGLGQQLNLASERWLPVPTVPRRWVDASKKTVVLVEDAAGRAA